MDQWNKPPIGVFKVNWNVACDQTNGKMGLGITVKAKCVALFKPIDQLHLLLFRAEALAFFTCGHVLQEY